MFFFNGLPSLELQNGPEKHIEIFSEIQERIKKLCEKIKLDGREKVSSLKDRVIKCLNGSARTLTIKEIAPEIFPTEDTLTEAESSFGALTVPEYAGDFMAAFVLYTLERERAQVERSGVNPDELFQKFSVEKLWSILWSVQDMRVLGPYMENVQYYVERALSYHDVSREVYSRYEKATFCKYKYVKTRRDLMYFLNDSDVDQTIKKYLDNYLYDSEMLKGLQTLICVLVQKVLTNEYRSESFFSTSCDNATHEEFERFIFTTRVVRKSPDTAKRILEIYKKNEIKTTTFEAKMAELKYDVDRIKSECKTKSELKSFIRYMAIEKNDLCSISGRVSSTDHKDSVSENAAFICDFLETKVTTEDPDLSDSEFDGWLFSEAPDDLLERFWQIYLKNDISIKSPRAALRILTLSHDYIANIGADFSKTSSFLYSFIDLYFFNKETAQKFISFLVEKGYKYPMKDCLKAAEEMSYRKAPKHLFLPLTDIDNLKDIKLLEADWFKRPDPEDGSAFSSVMDFYFRLLKEPENDTDLSLGLSERLSSTLAALPTEGPFRLTKKSEKYPKNCLADSLMNNVNIQLNGMLEKGVDFDSVIEKIKLELGHVASYFKRNTILLEEEFALKFLESSASLYGFLPPFLQLLSSSEELNRALQQAYLFGYLCTANVVEESIPYVQKAELTVTDEELARDLIGLNADFRQIIDQKILDRFNRMQE